MTERKCCPGAHPSCNHWTKYYLWRAGQPDEISLEAALAVLPGFGFTPDDVEEFVEHWDD